jgi:hypothetical protein
VKAGSGDKSDQAAEQRERVEVDRDGAVAERLLERDAQQAIGAGQQALGREAAGGMYASGGSMPLR